MKKLAKKHMIVSKLSSMMRAKGVRDAFFTTTLTDLHILSQRVVIRSADEEIILCLRRLASETQKAWYTKVSAHPIMASLRPVRR
jgi:hypothetical protein